MKQSKFIISFCLICSISLYAKNVTPASDLPTYYSSVNGTSGSSLFSTLTSITNIGYSSLSYKTELPAAYAKTDVFPKDSVGKAGQLWDMYGGCEFSTSDDCGGGYKHECDCWNKEHSIPQSWWGGGTGGIGCDIFHVIPTDGKVNGMRSNYEFGVVSSADYQYNGCKKGSAGSVSTTKKTIASTAGEVVKLSGTVFEPRDEFKGDLARGYLGTIMKWNQSKTITSSNKFFSGSYTASGNWGLTKKAVVILMKWHREDPVSQKEIDRNNAIQSTQGNRNPFIDYPYLAEYIWGEHAGEKVDMSKLISSSDSRFIPGVSDGSYIYTEPTISTVTSELLFNDVVAGGSVQKTFKVIGYCLTNGISLSISGQDANLFTVSPSSIAKSIADKEQTVTVTYSPESVGTSSATLTLSSNGAEDVAITLSGACQATCTINWMVDTCTYTLGKPTTEVALGGSISRLPTAPKSCSELSEQFVGWSQYEIADTTDVMPSDLFSDASEAPTVKSDMTFHAVFAHLSQSGGGEDSIIVYEASKGTAGWTNTKMKKSSDYYILISGSSLVSPEIDLSLLQSITINMRTYGGKTYKTIDMAAGSTKLGSLDADDSLMKDQTWTNSSSLKGTSAITFSSTTNSDKNGPALDKVTIQLQGLKYVYSRYVTKCTFSPTAIEDVEESPYTIQHTPYTKFLKDGRLYIQINNQIYNINGQLIQ